MSTITDQGYNQNLFNILHNLGVLASVDDMNVIIECVRSMKEELADEEPKPLPERWAIERTQENHERVNAWINQQGEQNYQHASGIIHSDAIGFSFPHLASCLRKGYTLITDEQFDRWVLNNGEDFSKVDPELIKFHKEYTGKPTPAIMEEKGLSIEEKKSLWKAGNTILTIKKRKGILESVNQEYVEKHCAPLFHTSIDNVPVWPKDVVWAIVKNQPTSFNAEDIFNEGFETSLSFEDAKKWIQDNRMVNLSDMKKYSLAAYKNYRKADGGNIEDFEKYLDEAFKELSKLSNDNS